MIDRRVLLNYRIDPDAIKRVLPEPFKPKLQSGYAIGGVCLIRFRELRPRGVPRWLGLRSENAAHRIAVEWMQDGERREGVYIPQRDTNSPLNTILGGRIFPGIFNRARFESEDTEKSISVKVYRASELPEIVFKGEVTEKLPESSAFPNLQEASNFFLHGSIGYSATSAAECFHGIELRALKWELSPIEIHEAKSNFFEDVSRFPTGAVELDCALLMRNIEHEWHSHPNLVAKSST